MATIKKTIQNLKPGKQYLLTVKPKDAELNVLLDPASAVRFTVPDDLTQPAELGDLTIVGNYKSIMISFNPSNEADLRGYNYEVYLPEDIAQSGSTYVIISGATPFISGFSASNVIAVDVPQNSETTNNVDSNTGVTTVVTTEKLYFARVQSIDTSENKSAWTPIVASTATTLIDSAHIIDLTASKITAGTIGAHTITLAGGTSVIKSSTFNGVDVGGGSYANATTGWLINGSGRAYFYDATIAGSIDIGGFDSGSFHVDSEGNLWLGSGTLVNAPFKVLKEGDVTANTITTKNLTLTGNTVMSSNSKIFLGVGEYSNTNTPFYVDDDSQFSLGNKLTWDGSTLTITGNVNITGGNTLTLISDAQSDADTAYNTAISAQGIAISAQSTANSAYSTANTKITAGFAAFDINNNATEIEGDKIRTGSLNANRISGGTIAASTSFVIQGGATITSANNLFTVDQNGSVFLNAIFSSSGNIAISCGGVNANFISVNTVRVNGTLSCVSLVQTSDARLKNAVTALPSGLNFVNKLNPVSFYFNKINDENNILNNSTIENEGKKKHFGFIAQELKQAMDESEFKSSDYSIWEEDDHSTQSISYVELVPLLVKAVQELSAKVEELESRLNS